MPVAFRRIKSVSILPGHVSHVGACGLDQHHAEGEMHVHPQHESALGPGRRHARRQQGLPAKFGQVFMKAWFYRSGPAACVLLLLQPAWPRRRPPTIGRSGLGKCSQNNCGWRSLAVIFWASGCAGTYKHGGLSQDTGRRTREGRTNFVLEVMQAGGETSRYKTT